MFWRIGNGPAVIKLQAAEPAVKKLPAKQAMDKVKRAPAHFIDAINTAQCLKFSGRAFGALSVVRML